jgi:S-adenosylmethionine synthetase
MSVRRIEGQNGEQLVVELGMPEPPAFTIVERKGAGHPDTLADQLAETLSRVYARETLSTFGAVLHHNFDKLALVGGASEVRYGRGRMLAPVRVLVNGRATRRCGDVVMAVDDLILSTVRDFFAERLPELAGHLSIDLNVTSNASPGAVLVDGKGAERTNWFAPASADALRERRGLFANDTSLGTGWAPENDVEMFVRYLADVFSAPNPFRLARPWCGSDVKVMAFADGDTLDIVLCVPQKSMYVESRAAYIRHYDEILEQCHTLAKELLPGRRCTFRLNARDIVERDEVYLTYTGSSIESGDEGVVGRGNRVNGLITPLRPMNLEGANGKNPVYHVGKLYNVAARQIAQALHERFGGHVEVHLISATGQMLTRPWRILVRLSNEATQPEAVAETLFLLLDAMPRITEGVVEGNVKLS